MTQQTMDLKFVDYKQGEKDGRKYYLLTLSNGIRSATTFPKTPIDASSLKEGDDVRVTFNIEIDYNNRFVAQPVDIYPI